MMLKDFVAQSIVAVGEAMAESARRLDAGGVRIGETADRPDGSPAVQILRFDLAIAAADETGGLIEVVEGAGKGANRLRFSVPVSLGIPRPAAEAERPTDLEWE